MVVAERPERAEQADLETGMVLILFYHDITSAENDVLQSLFKKLQCLSLKDRKATLAATRVGEENLQVEDQAFTGHKKVAAGKLDFKIGSYCCAKVIDGVGKRRTSKSDTCQVRPIENKIWLYNTAEYWLGRWERWT